MLLEKLTPFRDLDLMDRRMRHLFQELGATHALTPPADIYETDGELVVELEVPGFDEKELEIEIRDHTLSVKGEREEETSKKDTTMRLRERLETEFERRFDLPSEIDSKHVSATYAKGVLTLHVPKIPVEKPRTIPITKG